MALLPNVTAVAIIDAAEIAHLQDFVAQIVVLVWDIIFIFIFIAIIIVVELLQLRTDPGGVLD